MLQTFLNDETYSSIVAENSSFSQSSQSSLLISQIIDECQQPNTAPDISLVDDEISCMENTEHCVSFDNLNENNADYSFVDFDSIRKIHDSIQCSVKDAMSIIYAYSVRYSLTWEAVEDLVRLINSILGTNNLIPSKYLFKKMFQKKDNTTPVYHFWCRNCKKYLGTKEELRNTNMCENCNTEICKDVKYKKNHFISIPIEKHLKNLLERNSENIIVNRKFTPGVINDVHDAKNFQKLKDEMQNVPYITLLVYTDGAAVFKSTKEKSFWPINVAVNEIVLEHRFNRSNILCSAISFGKAPNMQIFFKPLIEEIKSINYNGGICFKNKNGQLKKVLIIPMIFTADALAKADVLNLVHHNGYNGCPYCLHCGTRIDGTSQIRYCNRDNAICRTNRESRSDMTTAHVTQTKINGYNGLSPLMAFRKKFDVVWQVVIDKMHCVDMGVIKKMFGLFLSSKNRGKR